MKNKIIEIAKDRYTKQINKKIPELFVPENSKKFQEIQETSGNSRVHPSER